MTNGERMRWSLWWRRTWIAGLTVLGLVIAVVVGMVVALRLEYAGTPTAHTRGRDALWLGHEWIDGRKDEGDVAALKAQLADTGIKDLYVFSGPLDSEGSLPDDRHPNASWFVDAVHREIPNARVQAWLGNFVAPEYPDELHLDAPDVRGNILTSTRQLLDLGFDGVHYDFEPIRSGTADFLTLLDQAHALTTGRHALLSIAAPQIDPLPGLHAPYLAVAGHEKWWSQTYFAAAAHRVDQIAVMSYDTAMPYRFMYGGYVAEQTTLALQVTPPSVDLLMGLPAYQVENIAHHSSAETVDVAIRAIRLGLGRTDPARPAFGVALFVDYTATPADWAAYRANWVTTAPTR
ncbi:hypothetical protein [Nocardia sp. NBC_01327]|uniref:hypothetical protein n=1 Tax=Nocardia sp. NBC_01327 TaxID=2903593 RepID=UPI002E15A49A|nr:hypothetical protein OG326_22185 [Nocardia sp. NBC_01327]